MADNVLYMGVRGVTDLMVNPGLVNLDFADIRTVMAEMGKAMMGTGEAEGDDRATKASEAAISNPLLEDISMRGAKGVLINITGGYDMTLFEVDEAANRIRKEIDEDANIIFGSSVDETMNGRLRVSVVATGIDMAEMASGRDAERPKLVAVGGGAAMPVQAVSATAMPSAAPAAAAIPMPGPAAVQRNPGTNFIRTVAETGAPTMRGPAVIAPVDAQPAIIDLDPAPQAGMMAPVAEAPMLLTPQARPMAAPEPQGPSTLQRGGQLVGGLFRKAMGSSLMRRDLPAQEAPRQAPMARNAYPSMPTEMEPEAPRPAARQATVQEDGKLEIPAFLRRQSN